jgi:hypothetical protein
VSALIGALVVLACPQEPVPLRRGFFVYGDRVFLASNRKGTRDGAFRLRPRGGTPMTRGHRLQIMLTPQELSEIDDWRYMRRMPSRAAAVRALLKLGLVSIEVEVGRAGLESQNGDASKQ